MVCTNNCLDCSVKEKENKFQPKRIVSRWLTEPVRFEIKGNLADQVWDYYLEGYNEKKWSKSDAYRSLFTKGLKNEEIMENWYKNAIKAYRAGQKDALQFFINFSLDTEIKEEMHQYWRANKPDLVHIKEIIA